MNKPESFEVYQIKHDTIENVVLLTDYEALQAEYEKLRMDVSVLVEALELVVANHNEGGWPTTAIAIARTVLADHKQRGDL